MARKRLGRPAEFKNRATLAVLLERDELVALRRRAEAGDMSASAYVRRLILRALAQAARQKE